MSPRSNPRERIESIFTISKVGPAVETQAPLILISFLALVATSLPSEGTSLPCGSPEVLVLDSDFHGGCGCSVPDTHGGTLFWSSYEDGRDHTEGLMKFRGHLARFRLTSSTERRGPRQTRVGDRFVRTYR